MEPFRFLDTETVAEQRRTMMIDVEKRRYYIADLSKSNMMKDTPITEKYFRIRTYIKPRESTDYGEKWMHANISEVWSTKFLGLSDDGFQKLEFQNPPYSAAYRLGGDPRQYNDTFVVQVNGCDYEYSFCFVDRPINRAEPGMGEYFTAEEMLDIFLEEQKKYREEGKPLNVIRLSGGETTCLVPELILDIADVLDKRGLSNSIYVWADCNLSTLKYLVNVENGLKEVARRKNFGIVGCLKSPGSEENGRKDFSLITKAKPEHFSKQFEVLDFLVNKIKADTYVYLVPILWDEQENCKQRLFSCAKRLAKIHKNLPLRTNIIKIRPYDVAQTNIMNAFREGRPLPGFDEKSFEKWCEESFIPSQRRIFKIWYEEVLPSLYKLDQIEKYRCQVDLN